MTQILSHHAALDAGILNLRPAKVSEPARERIFKALFKILKLRNCIVLVKILTY